MLHPWAGLIFFAAVCNMYVMWAPQMRHTDVDKAWWKAVRYYSTNQDDKMPPAGTLTTQVRSFCSGDFFLERGESLLCLSGLVLWFPEYIPWSLRWLRYIAVLVHASAALLTIGLFLIHVYMGVFAERGAFGSVIRGDVSIAFAKRYHPGWYKEIVRESSTPRK